MKMSIFSEVSLDGKITFGRNNSSKKFFSMLEKLDLRYIYEKRINAQGIIVGKKTIDIDNPMLTDRIGGNTLLLRIIPSNSLDFNFDSNIFKDDNPTLIVTSKKNINNKNIDLIKKNNKEVIFLGENEVDLKQLRNYLQEEKKMQNVIVEGGGYLNWKMLNADVIDEIVMLQFPIIIGGKDTPTLVDGMKCNEDIMQKYELSSTDKKDGFLVIKYEKINNSALNGGIVNE